MSRYMDTFDTHYIIFFKYANYRNFSYATQVNVKYIYNILTKLYIILKELVLWFMVFNATFNNISVISWRSDLMVEETRVSGEIHRPDKSLTNFIT